MAIDVAEMEEEAGVEIGLGTAEWNDFGPSRGQVVAVPISHPDYGIEGEEMVPFLIMQVSMIPDEGGLVLEVKSLGGINSEVDSKLSSQFNRRRGTLHLCQQEPCPHFLSEHQHVTRLVWWKGGISTFKGGSSSCRRQVDKWLKKEEVVGEGGLTGGALRPSAKVVPEKPKEVSGAGRSAERRKGKKVPKNPPDEEDSIPEDKREALLSKLKALKDRLRGPSGKEKDGEAEDRASPSSPEEVESSPPPEGLDVGMDLVVAGKEAARKKIEKRERKVRKEKREPLEDSRDSSTKHFQKQLVGQALAVSKTEAGDRKRSSSKSERMSSTLARILTKTVKEDRKRKKKKKDKKKKKKKKKKGKGDGDGDGDGSSSPSSSSSGATGSCSGSSKDPGGSQSSEYDLEAPLKKKSKKNPGSVLELLVNHAREQLDQSAAVEVGSSKQSVTSGVKLMTYFQVLLKPKIGGSPAQMREMHHLVTAIDLLRQGRLGLLGDTLAARFLCLHQSILDGGWQAAKHLEIFPMEEMSAASPSLMLRTRKHAKLAARAQGWDVGHSWGGAGRGSKGKGKQDWKGGDTWEPKGKGKKGGKGKGKGNKSNWWNNQDHSKGDQEWKDNKEGKSDK